MKKIVFRHLLIWLVLSVGFFFLAEPLVKLLFPSFHDVGIWILTEFVGLVAILLSMTTLLIINIGRHKRRVNASS